MTESDRNAKLLFPTVKLLAVPVIFTVGTSAAAFLAGFVKGGGRYENLYIKSR